MKKVVLYECNICHTLLHNNKCECGNSAAISNKDCSICYIFVDDITTVSPIVCYIGNTGVVKRIDSYASINTITPTINNTSAYRKYAKNYYSYAKA